MKNNTVTSKVDGQKIGTMFFKTEEDITFFLSSPAVSSSSSVIATLKNILEVYRDLIANLLIHELGKPYSESYNEIDRTLEYIQINSLIDSPPHKQLDLLVIGYMSNPVFEFVTTVYENIAYYDKIIYKSSSKSSLTLDFIYQKILLDIETTSRVMIIPMAKENLDKALDRNKFAKIINYSRAKFDKRFPMERRSKKDWIVILDSQSDMDVASAFVADNILNYEKFNLAKAQHIFVEHDVVDLFCEKLISKIGLLLKTGKPDKEGVNFCDNFRFYKRNQFREFLLDVVSAGGDLIYGSVQNILSSPLIMKLDEKLEEYYIHDFWFPLIFIISYNDIASLPHVLSDFEAFNGKSYLTFSNFEYIKKRTSIEYL